MSSGLSIAFYKDVWLTLDCSRKVYHECPEVDAQSFLLCPGVGKLTLQPPFVLPFITDLSDIDVDYQTSTHQKDTAAPPCPSSPPAPSQCRPRSRDPHRCPWPGNSGTSRPVTDRLGEMSVLWVTLSFLQFLIRGNIRPLILFRICWRQILSCLKSRSVILGLLFTSTDDVTTLSLFLSFFLLLSMISETDRQAAPSHTSYNESLFWF